MLLADCLWNAAPHEGLLQTLRRVLAPRGEVWCAHQHHWPGHELSDKEFFGRAAALGFRVDAWDDEAAGAEGGGVGGGGGGGARNMTCLFEDEATPVYVHRFTWAGAEGSATAG